MKKKKVKGKIHLSYTFPFLNLKYDLCDDKGDLRGF